MYVTPLFRVITGLVTPSSTNLFPPVTVTIKVVEPEKAPDLFTFNSILPSSDPLVVVIIDPFIELYN